MAICFTLTALDAVQVPHGNTTRTIWGSSNTELKFLIDDVLETYPRRTSRVECAILCANNEECYAFDHKEDACVLYTLHI